ncbi:NFX1-type zinc finger-containing protein 1-like isoform X2 [Galleria mellonella]|uniref:NFX1-type zinc finger-containing protein 1-like isoform X2 n=1 Tax=Galleria mellonella TaxID=7137 RepID=A0A6J3BX92_GALME|nr:NFX1-type zinc finger-containing protein 1-like isoform X2 [Galleria mellonella]
MSEQSKPTLRIDWFDGTLIEDNRQITEASASGFADEEQAQPETSTKPQFTEKKPIGFKRLLDISSLEPPVLTLEVSHRPGFWNLLDIELKGDFIVLIVKVLARIYKSLEPNEKSRIASQLRSRFEKSNFLVTLKKYLAGLPSVRIVEKKINFQLWNDTELFFSDVVSLCEGIIHFGDHTIEYLKEIFELLEITDESAVGVKEEHTETFSDALFNRIDQLKLKISEMISEDPSEQVLFDDETPDNKCDDPYNYKNLHIFPKREDLLGTNKLNIQPNIINGAYTSVQHYLDLQFKLLREDYFGTLRDGICKYMENPSKRRHENIRVYPKVRIIRTYVSNNRVGHLIDIAWKERTSYGMIDSKKLAYNRQLMFGSLLLFTSDNFENILCATVLDSGMNLLSDGYVAVSFQSPVSKKIFTEPYLMVESEVFFEPYHRVLKVLQNSRVDGLPMRKYIVDVQTETQAPSYLNSETLYTVTQANKLEEISFPVLDLAQWPTDNLLGLDNSQYEAYKFALTREFAVIQGPPGTGKTFIGVKIATTLLKNLSLSGTPMLIICYTNHALDQFLEGILEVTKNIIRLGSQSKSKILEPYTLNNMRMQMKSKYSYLYGSKRAELEKIFKEMTDLQSEIEKCEKEILTYKTIKPYLKIGDKTYELEDSKEDPILNWLFDDTKREKVNTEELEDWEKQFDDLSLDNEKIETCFSEESALREIDSMLNNIKYIKDITDDRLERQKMTDKFQIQINTIRQRLNCFKNMSNSTNVTNLEDNLTNVTDLYNLNLEQRWRVYNNSVASIKSKLMTKMNTLLEQHNKCSDELNEVATLIDGEVMKSVRVVGVTTTTAARRHDLMKKLLSPIVIVEEAAEVLEAHIVASLTHHCQHLILIGDHKQLRPTAAHYKLAKDYNLEISLFERMIRNGVHARTLTTQRRMRPTFAELLVPILYDRLDSHPSVYSYTNVRGMADNLYFLDHDVYEDSEGLEDSWSHRNTYEAEWCVALANYLRSMKYKPEEITILSTYTGQVSLIRELSKKYSTLRDVKVTPVDNYQGEENRIILLSLVRSNRDGKIGFLTAANRICVALSRAKEGFYIFGNMNTLKSASNIWRFINDKLRAQKSIGNKLIIQCDSHKRQIEVTCPNDFDNHLSCTCLRICEKK